MLWPQPGHCSWPPCLLTGCSLAMSASLMRSPSSLESSCTVSAGANRAGADRYGRASPGAAQASAGCDRSDARGRRLTGAHAPGRLSSQARPSPLTRVGGRVLAGGAVAGQAGVEALLVLHRAAQGAEARVAHVASQPAQGGAIAKGKSEAQAGLARMDAQVACVCSMQVEHAVVDSMRGSWSRLL